MKVCERGTFFPIKGTWKGYSSVKIVHKKVKGLNLGVQPARIKLSRVPLPPGDQNPPGKRNVGAPLKPEEGQLIKNWEKWTYIYQHKS